MIDKARSITPILGFILLLSGHSNAEEKVDIWQPVRFLLGTWVNVEGQAKITQTYAFVLQDKFIQSKSRAEFPPKEGETEGEVHEDIGYLSYDPAEGRIMWREFLSEGYVNTYVLQNLDESNNKRVFLSEHSEGVGGMKVRLIIEMTSENTYTMYLDLAPPGKDFFTCQTFRMQRSEKEE